MRSWAEIKAVVAEVLELPPSERIEFIDRVCAGDTSLRAEVLRFVRGEAEADRLIPSERWAGDALTDGTPDTVGPGMLLGQYRLVRDIGHGGMGTVYLAEREDHEFARTVAVKVLRRGSADPDLVRRFRSERQILAAIDHPHIAKLFDGGSTADGRPFLVMEYVDGRPIDEYCDAKRLTIAERLRLFQKVCAAVQVAHQSLVIHRDIKPANLLVTADGEPKLLDFGIAKLIRPDAALGEPGVTMAGTHPMTPEYASPEQARALPVTTASDVYSLGVVLYELVSGRRPYVIPVRDLAAAIRVITVEVPMRPSSAVGRAGDRGPPSGDEIAARRGEGIQRLRRTLRGDLDNIILKALHKDPERRYALAAALSQDLERYLARRPVVARSDTLAYRVTRFVQRHRTGVPVAAALILALVGSSVFAIRARDRAEREAAKAQAINEFLQGMLGSADANRGGNQRVTVQEALAAGAARAAVSFRGQPELEAAVRETIGTTYVGMGQYELGEQQLVSARDLRLASAGPRHPDVARSLYLLGWLSFQRGDFRPARSRLLEAVELQRILLGSRHPDVGITLHLLGVCAQDAGDDESASRFYREAIEIFRRGSHRRLGLVLGDLASLMLDREESAQAEALYREAVTLQRALAHPGLVQTLDFFAVHQIRQGHLEEAERLLVEEEGLLRARYAAHSLEFARFLGTWGRLLRAQGRLGESASSHGASYEMFEAILGAAHVETANAQVLFGDCLMELGDGRAHAQLAQALEVQSRALGPDHPSTKQTEALVRRLPAPSRVR
jgi:eukaryotic-like serine/threonine-protein kinase